MPSMNRGQQAGGRGIDQFLAHLTEYDVSVLSVENSSAAGGDVYCGLRSGDADEDRGALPYVFCLRLRFTDDETVTPPSVPVGDHAAYWESSTLPVFMAVWSVLRREAFVCDVLSRRAGEASYLCDAPLDRAAIAGMTFRTVADRFDRDLSEEYRRLSITEEVASLSTDWGRLNRFLGLSSERWGSRQVEQIFRLFYFCVRERDLGAQLVRHRTSGREGRLSDAEKLAPESVIASLLSLACDDLDMAGGLPAHEMLRRFGQRVSCLRRVSDMLSETTGEDFNRSRRECATNPEPEAETILELIGALAQERIDDLVADSRLLERTLQQSDRAEIQAELERVEGLIRATEAEREQSMADFRCLAS